MPPDAPWRLYWDADVFLSYIDDHPERAPLIELLLGDARAGDVEIYTSSLSLVEVAFSGSERTAGGLDVATEQQITDLWSPGSPVRVVEFFPLIGTRARNLIREGVPRGWTGLRANDAVHLATAAHMNVDEMHTYESMLPRYSEDLGFPIREPRTKEPRIV